MVYYVIVYICLFGVNCSAAIAEHFVGDKLLEVSALPFWEQVYPIS